MTSGVSQDEVLTFGYLHTENLTIFDPQPNMKKTYGSCSPVSTVSTTDGNSSSDADTDESSLATLLWSVNVFSEDALNRFREVGRRHAHEPQDVLLCWKLCELMDLDEIAAEGLIVTVYRNLRLLHLCKYDIFDILLTMAYTALYVIEAIALGGVAEYRTTEKASLNISMFFYLAASHCLDTCAPLFCWTKHVFLNRVPTSFLAKRTMLLFRMRNFRLGMDYENRIEKLAEQLNIAVDAYKMQPELTELTESALPRVGDLMPTSHSRAPPPYSP